MGKPKKGRSKPRSRCKQCIAASSSVYRKFNKEKVNEYQKRRRKLGLIPKRKYSPAYNKMYKLKFKYRVNANNARRRANRLKQTPPWAELKSIEAFYRECPKGYHVDHIIPLQGANISGLHVLSNLQYLPAMENLKKGNKWPQL